jgi:hypothetical protein
MLGVQADNPMDVRLPAQSEGLSGNGLPLYCVPFCLPPGRDVAQHTPVKGKKKEHITCKMVANCV